jgi:Protein of unknown function (DUF3631)
LSKLVDHQDREWDTCEFQQKPLTTKSLARRLKRFKINPVQERVSGHPNPVRIYKNDHKLIDVWKRYLKGIPETAVTNVTPVTPVTDGDASTSLNASPFSSAQPIRLVQASPAGTPVSGLPVSTPSTSEEEGWWSKSRSIVDVIADARVRHYNRYE